MSHLTPEISNNRSKQFPFFEDPIDAGFVGKSTIKETFPSKPDIIIRSNPDDEVPIEKAIKAKEEYENLRSYGIHIPGLEIVQGDNLYLITDRVYGENLEESIVHPDLLLLHKFESLTVGLLNYLYDRKQPRSTFLRDIYGPHQYVYGHLNNQVEREIYLVDLELRITYGIKSERFWTELWLNDVKYIAMDLLEVESISGQKLKTARKTFQEFLFEMPKEGLYLPGQRMIKKILSGKKVTDEEWESAR